MARTPAFGAGGGEPYGAALLDGERTLSLQEYRPDGGTAEPRERPVEVDRFRRAADDTDGAAIRDAVGPVLDVGCGPGRMVRAAASRGLTAMGIDVSGAAVRLAQHHGLPVLRRSVFEQLPGIGRWGTVILMDGNIGIGGDPIALLRRCAVLVRPAGGRLIIETSSDPLRDRSFQGLIVDDVGRRSLPFAWAEVGAIALRRSADAAGLVRQREWSTPARCFAVYTRP